MKNDFLKNIKNIENNSASDFQDQSYTEIIDKLLIKKLHGSEKLSDIDSYDAESLAANKIIPGNIYILAYQASTPTIYTLHNNKTITFSDTNPIILVTSTNGEYIHGINLNLCNYGLRALLLNIFYNLDPTFFEKTAEIMANNKKFPISNNIIAFLQRPNAEQIINDYLQSQYQINSYNIIFRTYNIKNIKTLRLIEYWQWKYVVFLNYNGTIKKDILNMIYNITGISKIKI